MGSVSVRQLKERTSAVLRTVRERGEPVDVTYRGRVVARLVPVEPAPVREHDLAAVWRDIDQLADEIAAYWPAGVTAVDAVREQRREL